MAPPIDPAIGAAYCRDTLFFEPAEEDDERESTAAAGDGGGGGGGPGDGGGLGDAGSGGFGGAGAIWVVPVALIKTSLLEPSESASALTDAVMLTTRNSTLVKEAVCVKNEPGLLTRMATKSPHGVPLACDGRAGQFFEE